MRIVALMLVTVVAGCAVADGSLDERERSALERRLADRVAGEPQDCVPIVQNTAFTAVDRRTLVYDPGGTVWVNRLRDDCGGLRADSAILIEASGGRYCRNDRIRSLDPGSSIPGPVCMLGEFTPYRRR
jgi:hypothetical protein